MTTLPAAIVAQLRATSTVTALVSTRIYPDQREQASALPCVVYFRVSEMLDQHLGGLSGLRMARYQFDCWASTRVTADAVAEALIAAMDGWDQTTKQGVQFENVDFSSVRSGVIPDEAGGDEPTRITSFDATFVYQFGA